ncbi:MAG: PAS domain-containing protein [Candidatus Velthaea sp.]
MSVTNTTLDPLWIEAMDTLPIVVWTALPDGRIEFVNKRWYEMTGVPQAAVVNDGWRALVHPEDLAHTAALFEASVASGTPISLETRMRTPDGSVRWTRAQGAPMRDKNQRIVRWFGVTVDIDDIKRTQDALQRAEAELSESERRFRVLAEAIPVIVWTADANGWIDWYNHRWEAYTGQTRAESAGWGWQTAHHPEDFPEVMQRWPESIASGQPFEMEFRLRGADGVFRWFLTRINPLRDAAGNVVRWYGSNVEIDEQRRALERSTRIAQILQTVFLPTSLPQHPGLRFDAVYLPSERDALVGGDWYDVAVLPDNRILFSIGDVVGHGLEASTVAGRIRQTIHAIAFEAQDPAMLLRAVNRVVLHQEGGAVATAIVGFIDEALRTVTYASAGHPAPIVANPGERARILPHDGLPLGVSDDLRSRRHDVTLQQDAALLLYTDGFTEFARDVAAAEQRLKAATESAAGHSTSGPTAREVALNVLNGHPNIDDAALLLIQFAAAVPATDLSSKHDLSKTWRFHSSDAHSARTSRHELIKYIKSLADDSEDLFIAELILGEILANTVEHAPGLVEINIDWQEEKPLVRVLDTGHGFDLGHVAESLPADPLDENGRGIFLIRSLAENLTVQRSPGYGTEICATLPVRRAPSNGQLQTNGAA